MCFSGMLCVVLSNEIEEQFFNIWLLMFGDHLSTMTTGQNCAAMNDGNTFTELLHFTHDVSGINDAFALITQNFDSFQNVASN